MSTEDNKAVVQDFFAHTFADGTIQMSGFDRYCADELVAHHLPSGLSGKTGLKRYAQMFIAAMSDIRFEMQDLIAEDDKVVTRWTVQMTHTGELMGFPGTGRQIILTGIDINRIENGKIQEYWQQMDIMGIMQQLGAMG